MDTGDTAWMLVAAALVLLMTPGLAFFYGGMVRAASVLNMLMMSFVSMGIVTVLWAAFGFSIAFGTGGNGFYGDFSMVGLGELLNQETTINGAEIPIPALVFALFQLMFAIITPALISGAIADRAKFTTWAIFVAIWASVIYFPVAHWVFAFGDLEGNGAGWLAALGVEDYAGGTAVHINAGAAALALVIVLGRRNGWPLAAFKPHSLPLVMLGAGLLWFGWIGFNAGSGLGANALAGLTFMNTMVATAAAMLGWLTYEKLRHGSVTSLGAASGIVAGLVAITPACAFVVPAGAAAIGLISGVLCAWAVSWKFRFGLDDSLDVVGVHLVGGIVGSLLIGLFGTTKVEAAGGWGLDGLFYGGGWELLKLQVIGVFSVLVFSFVGTLIIGYLLQATIGFRLHPDDEEAGVDRVAHAESAYVLAASSGGRFTPTSSLGAFLNTHLGGGQTAGIGSDSAVKEGASA